MTPKKLNLGSGNSPRREGYLNVDIVPGENVDLVFDLSKKLPFGAESIDEIYSHHLFEHLINYEEVLDDWYRVLTPGGRLEINTPNMDGICHDWVDLEIHPYVQLGPFSSPEAYKRHLIKMAIGESGGYMRHQSLFWPDEIKRVLETHRFSVDDIKVESQCAGPAMKVLAHK